MQVKNINEYFFVNRHDNLRSKILSKVKKIKNLSKHVKIKQNTIQIISFDKKASELLFSKQINNFETFAKVKNAISLSFKFCNANQ